MRICELRLQSHNLDQQRAFYGQTLGLPVTDGPDGSLAITIGRTQLVLEPAATDEARYHVAFNVPENKLEEAHRWLGARVPILEREGQEIFDFAVFKAHAMYFEDAAGNVMELITRHNLHNRTEGPFGPHDLLCVSEIGLAMDEVPARAAQITELLGTPAWGKQSLTFTPMGDEEGLFILVNTGRHWLPTQIAAAPHPTAVTIEGSSPGSYTLDGLPYRFSVTASPSR